MNTQVLADFWPFMVCVLTLFVIGFYCLVATLNLIRALIGIEILIKAITLLIIVVGYVSGHSALTQSLVITMIVIEAVIITIAVGLVVGIYRKTNSLDSRNIRNLKG